MNERIKELKQQAADYVDSIDNGIDIEEYRKLLDQKFAELIVKECVSVMYEDNGATHHCELLFTHFGVEK